MKTKKSLPMVLRAQRCLFILTLFTIVFSASISAAQSWPPCPTCPTTIPPTSVAWTSNSVIASIQLCPAPAPPCNVQICYCTRTTSPGNNDFTITQISIDNSGGCANCGPSYQTVIDGVNTWLLDHNPMNFPCPPCPTTTNFWGEVRGQCWQQTTVNDIIIFTWCGGLAYCNTRWKVCCDPTTGAQTRTKMSTVITGQCNAGCNTVTCP